MRPSHILNSHFHADARNVTLTLQASARAGGPRPKSKPPPWAGAWVNACIALLNVNCDMSFAVPLCLFASERVSYVRYGRRK